MIRTLMATTALAALLATGAIAQDATTTPAAPATTEAPAADAMAPAADAMAPATDAMAPATDAATPVTADPAAATDVAGDVESGAMEETDINEPFDMSAGYVAADTDNLGSRLIGQPVYSSAGDDAEEIGNIDDLVFDEGGQINAVVVGVGGFLGIGEKAVAIDFDALEFTLAADNTERWVVATTADALTAAPDFVWEEDEPADTNDDAMATDAMAPAATDSMAPATDTTAAPADAMAPADPAMAPATDTASPMAMPREGYNTVETEALTADNLTGATVVGPDGNDIATVGDILLSAEGSVDAMLVDFGGFLGIGKKTVAVSMDNLEFAANENGDLIVYSDFTQEQLEAAPEYDEAAYAADPSMRATDL